MSDLDKKENSYKFPWLRSFIRLMTVLVMVGTIYMYIEKMEKNEEKILGEIYHVWQTTNIEKFFKLLEANNYTNNNFPFVNGLEKSIAHKFVLTEERLLRLITILKNSGNVLLEGKEEELEHLLHKKGGKWRYSILVKTEN